MRVLIKMMVCCFLVFSTGCVYSNFRVPLDQDFDKTTLGSKVGKSEYQTFLWLVAWGDAGSSAAAKDGGIKTLNHADQEFLAILFGLYTKHTTIVYGE